MRLIDRTAHGNRWRHRHPLEKLVLAIGLLAAVLVLPPRPTAPLVLLVTLAAATLGARIPPATVLKVLAVPAGFLLLGLPGLVISLRIEPGLAIGLVPGGLTLALDVGLRALAAASCLALLILTTPLPDLVHGLRRLGVPKPFIEVMLVTYRLIFVLVETAAAGSRAQAARLGYAGFRRGCRAFALLAAALLATALARARRLEAGLAARGYDGDLAVLTDGRPPSLPGLALAAAAVAAVVMVGGLAG